MAKDNTARILKVIADNTGENEGNIKPHHSLTGDLQCDSLDCIEIMLGLEEEFGIEVDEDSFKKLRTVQQVIDYVADVCTADITHASFFCQAHHTGCFCREQKVATLNKAALDCAMELDRLKNEFSVKDERLDQMKALINRVHAASYALGAAQ